MSAKLSTKKRRELAARAIALLKDAYPDATCMLEHNQPHELLIATRLSAQCTDKRVNMVTPALFERYPTIDAFAQADENEVAQYIKSCGLFKTKAHDIVMMCRQLRDEFGGVIPDTIEQLTTLPGVGRKTANLIVGDLYGKPAIVADTHVIRLSGRLGLAEGTDAGKVEAMLREVVPPEEGLILCHRLVRHGRLVCSARTPACDMCQLKSVCNQYISQNQG